MKPIPPFRLTAVPLDEDAKTLPGFKWAGKGIGTRHQLGGSPTDFDDGDWPTCVCCKSKMTFYGQLDSINDEYCIADCAMIYVFACLDCNETQSIIQSG